LRARSRASACRLSWWNMANRTSSTMAAERHSSGFGLLLRAIAEGEVERRHETTWKPRTEPPRCACCTGDTIATVSHRQAAIRVRREVDLRKAAKASRP
jgi:hypothetical protein